MNYYEKFIEYHKQQGRVFPCCADAFILRAIDFAREYVITCEEVIDTDELVNELCCQGIGPHWDEE